MRRVIFLVTSRFLYVLRTTHSSSSLATVATTAYVTLPGTFSSARYADPHHSFFLSFIESFLTYRALGFVAQENYDNVEVARQTVRNLIEAGKRPDTVIILAHEKERENEMPLFPASINEWAVKELENRRRV